MSTFQETLEKIISNEETTNPFESMGGTPSTSREFAFADGLLSLEARETIKELSRIIGVDEDMDMAARQFLDQCKLAHYKALANQKKLFDEKGTKYGKKHNNRQPPKEAIKSLEKIIKKSGELRKALETEPAPQMLDVSLELARKTNNGYVGIDNLLRKLERQANYKKENIRKYGAQGASIPTAKIFILHIYYFFLDYYDEKLNYKNISVITSACTEFGADENNVKKAIHDEKLLKNKK